MMPFLKTLLIVPMLLVQEDFAKQARELVERLRSDKVEERDEAVRRLKAMGPPALPDLEKAEKDTDPEVARLAQFLVRVIPIAARLSPNLMKTLPGVEDRLAGGTLHTWLEVLRDASSEDEKGRPKFPLLKAGDLEGLVESAVRGAATDDDKEELSLAILRKWMVSAVPVLVRYLSDPSREVRRRALSLLSTMAGKRESAQIIKMLGDPEESVRVTAVVEIGNARLRSAAREIRVLLGDKNSEIRRYAAYALMMMGAREAIPDIKPLLKESQAQVVAHAIQALGSLNAREVIPDILPFLEHENPEVRWFATQALGSLEAKGCVPEIVKRLSDDNDNVKSAAASALATLGAVTEIPRVAALLGDPSSYVRASAAEALAAFGTKEYLPQIRALLKSDDAFAQSRAIQALSSLEDTASVPDFVKLLKDDSGEARVRGDAALALARLGVKSAEREIRPLLQYGDSSARILATTSLCLLGSREAAPALLKEATEDENASCNALNALRQPKMWARLQAQRLRRSLSGTGPELAAHLGKEAGLSVVIDDPRSEEEREWAIAPRTISSGIMPCRLGDAFEGILPADTYLLIVEAEAVRIVPRAKALLIWKEWLAGQGLK